MKETWHTETDIQLTNPDKRPGVHTLIPWDDVCRKVTDWNNRAIDRYVLMKHVKHRVFGPYDEKAVEALIDDAISAGVFDERKDGRLEYTNEFVSIPLTNGEFNMELQSA